MKRYRVQFSLPEELAQAVDRYCRNNDMEEREMVVHFITRYMQALPPEELRVKTLKERAQELQEIAAGLIRLEEDAGLSRRVLESRLRPAPRGTGSVPEDAPLQLQERVRGKPLDLT